MTQMNKSEINELLSSYIDDELSERHQNEVKRLIQNDEKVAEQLVHLRKQKELLAALPIVSAPKKMIADIKASIAMEQILTKQTQTKSVARGEKELFGRRMLTIAAMLLIPVSILAWVVYTIVKPVSETGVTLPMATKPVETHDKVLAVSFPLSATLYLNTPQMTSMTDFINKAIYKNSLVNYTRSSNFSDMGITYTINGNRQRILALLREITTVWDKCEQTAMTVHGTTVSSNVRVDQITPDQILALYQADVFSDPMVLARDFDRMNRLIRSVPDYGTNETASYRNYIAMAPAIPVKPELTSSQPSQDDVPQTDPVDNATLFISISAP